MILDFENHIFQVSEINECIEKIFDDVFYLVKVEGEVVNITKSKNNHIYFAIKDNKSILNVVCWSHKASKFKDRIEDGKKVCCIGSISNYNKGSRYQLNLDDMIVRDDKGDFLMKLQKLKEKLQKDGLFDIANKKNLPKYPAKIALITSKNGAVIHDMIHRISDRFPCEVVICDVSVQGEKATSEIISYLRKINTNIDLIIIARGGGSNEDFSCFNDETLLRTVYQSQIPIVSAIGHESDSTLLDLVADFSAPTPTAAIELALPLRSELYDFLKQKQKKFQKLLSQKVSLIELKIENYKKINQIFKYKFSNLLVQFDSIKNKLSSIKKEKMNGLENKIKIFAAIIDKHDHKKILNLGYAIVRQNQKIVPEKKNLQVEQNFSVIFRDGEILTTMVKND